jgi:hypothetical protein
LIERLFADLGAAARVGWGLSTGAGSGLGSAQRFHQETTMTKVMVTIRARTGPPTVEAVIERYRLGPDDIDSDYGLVEIDPADHLYVILVEPDAAARIQPTEQWETAGPYSNPRIAPFGPPEPEPPTPSEEE